VAAVVGTVEDKGVQPLAKDHIGEMYGLSRWLENRPGMKEVDSAVDLD
jgi:hypothetical protein